MKIRIRAWIRDGDFNNDSGKQAFVMYSPEELAMESCDKYVGMFVNVDDQQYFMLSTGLWDKNGKEIFDGDIVHYKYLPGKGMWNAEYDGVISWQSTGFHIKPFPGKGGLDGWLVSLPGAFPEQNPNELFEVIGNIHQNPELVKEMKE